MLVIAHIPGEHEVRPYLRGGPSYALLLGNTP